jgi:hypothetical protein
MSLIHRRTTETGAVASRANGAKSTGPATEPGKLRSRMNALEHGMRAEVSLVVPELRESDQELEDLQMQFLRKLQPQDDFEGALVEQMVENRWRRRRVLRAESSLLVARRFQFDIEHSQLRAGESRSPGSAGELGLAQEVGLASLPNSSAKFGFILQCLRAARRTVESDGFSDPGLKCLEAVYGPNPGLAGAALLSRYREFQKVAPGPDSSSLSDGKMPAHRTEFVALLDAEISSFEKLQELQQISRDELPAILRETLNLLPDDDLNRILRYESFLDRQYDRLLKQLEQWQAARRKDHADRNNDW